MSHSYSCDECKKPVTYPVYEFITLFGQASPQNPMHFHWECFKRYMGRIIHEESEQ